MSYPTKFVKYGGWLPSNEVVHRSFIHSRILTAKDHQKHAPRNKDGQIQFENPAVQAFKDDIKGDKLMEYLFEQAFLQISDYKESTEPQVRDFDTLLSMLDHILQQAPSYHVVKDEHGQEIGEPIGVPIYLIFDRLSNTSAAYDLFRLPKFNVALKKLLDAWGAYLKDPTKNSNAVLNTTGEGWFGEAAMQSLGSKIVPLTFEETYILPDPSKETRGFDSWDAFFTRQVRADARPIGDPKPEVLHNACESTVYRIGRDVKLHDQFWLKGQKYSLYDILNRNESFYEYFIGGTVYQAFLSPLDYHRWHAPVSGHIEKIEVIDGSYYAALPDEGAPKDDPDLPEGSPYGALIRSQSFLTITASRALIYIQADNKDFGLVCFVGVGMAEVSTCDVTVREKQHVDVGDELGMFHFGGSSHALIFGPKSQITFENVVQENTHLKVNSAIGRVHWQQ
ncbi:hypothetical protein HWV62_6319 [Athelia sp. TMB]|nr:hypothetical protein HWV62_6319 [Athelia sp. TMB]